MASIINILNNKEKDTSTIFCGQVLFEEEKKYLNVLVYSYVQKTNCRTSINTTCISIARSF